MLGALLCAGLALACPGAGAGAATAPVTGGAQIPQLIAPSSGGAGYGQPGMRTLVVAPTALVGHVVVVRGRMPRAPGRPIVLQRFDERHGWRDVRRSRVRADTRFAVGWRPDRSGRTALRVVPVRRVSAAAAAPIARVDVYRPALATFFGPGLYGRKTYCGQTLTPLLLGVAHRTLPCGTQVAILVHRREILVPVVDRGPFNAGYDWDLTQATADVLGFTTSGTIGYVRMTRAPG